MPRRLHETPLTTPNARRKLAPGTYWRRVDADVHLGYRKQVRSGRWLVRWRVNDAYRKETIGTADDALDADGINTMTFDQASRRAGERVEHRRAEAVAHAGGLPLTVRRAVEEYLA